jgi:putative tricarboxylic transport membrane protein
VRGSVTARVTAVVLILVAAAVALEASTFDVAFLTDPVGPKALPLFVAAVLAAAGVAQLVRPDIEAAWPPGPVLLRVGAGAGVFLVYAAVLPVVGFFLSTTAAVAGLGMLFGGPPLRAALASAALTAGLWLLFVGALGLPLPVGDLWTL